jgi:Domain of unknown function (DUF4160)
VRSVRLGPLATGVTGRVHTPATAASDAASVAVAGLPYPRRVPRISEFYGIAIYMYWVDHPPPHFHALYGGEEAVVAIADGTVIAGALPRTALRLVREWLDLHREELEANWERAAVPDALVRIDPLR